MRRNIYSYIAIASFLIACMGLTGCSVNEKSDSYSLSDTKITSETSNTEVTSVNESNVNTAEDISDEEDDSEVVAIGGPIKYDSDGNPMYNEYGPKYEKTWKSNDGNIEFVLNNLLGIEGRGGYDCKYIFEGKVYNVEIRLEIDSMSIDVENIVSDDIEDTFIVYGSLTPNKTKDKFTVTVEDVLPEIKTLSGDSIGSIYKVGDKIEFYRLDD